MVDYSINSRLNNGSNGDNILTKNKYNLSTNVITIKSNFHKFTSILFVIVLAFGNGFLNFGMEKKVSNSSAHANSGAHVVGNNFNNITSDVVVTKMGNTNANVTYNNGNIQAQKINDGKIEGKQLFNESFAGRVYVVKNKWPEYDKFIKYLLTKTYTYKVIQKKEELEQGSENKQYIFALVTFEENKGLINIDNKLNAINTDVKQYFQDIANELNKNRTTVKEYLIYCEDANNMENLPSSPGLFKNSEATKIEILSCGTDVKNMRNMFANCNSLTRLDLSNFNTTQVKNMSYMFYNCRSLTRLNLSNFKTNTVTNMSWMFAECSNLTSLNLSSFNTKNVTNMREMFKNCSSLTNLNLSSFNTSNVENTIHMFEKCFINNGILISTGETLKEIICKDSCFKITEKIKKVICTDDNSNKIYYCNINSGQITNVKEYNSVIRIIENKNDDVNGNNTVDIYLPKNKKVTQLVSTNEGKINNGKKLVNYKFADKVYFDKYNDIFVINEYDKDNRFEINEYGKFTIKNVNNDNIIRSDTRNGLSTNYNKDIINIKNYLKNNTSDNVLFFKEGLGINDNNNEIENVNYIFASVTVDGQEYFIYCSDANSIVVENGCFGLFAYSDATRIEILSCGNNITNMRGMFFNCSSLTTLNLSNFNTKNVTYMGGMFYNCRSLTSLNLSSFDTENVINICGMFALCTSLTSLNLSNFNTANVTNMSYMFTGCISLTSLNLSNFNTANVTNMSYMFTGCSSLTSLDLSKFNTTNVTDMSQMFYNCSSLESLNLSNFNTGNVKDMKYMFSGCFTKESDSRLICTLAAIKKITNISNVSCLSKVGNNDQGLNDNDICKCEIKIEKSNNPIITNIGILV